MPPRERTLNQTINWLRRQVPQWMKEGSVTGTGIGLVQNGEVVWSGGFGLRNADADPVETDTVFQAASLSKPVFGYAAMKLVQRQELDLDRPLYEYLPYKDAAHDSRYKQITARMALSHSGGFPNWRPRGKDLKIHFTPGKRYRYSGEGFVYLQKVVEHLTGEDLDTLARRLVFTPLKMADSSYVWQDKYENRVAVGHDNEGKAGDKDRPDQGNAAYSLHTTAPDYARFLAAMVKGKGLRKNIYRQMLTPQIHAAENVFWGLGCGLQQDGGDKGFWQWGHQAGYRAYVLGLPESQSGVVLFTNSAHGLSIARALLTETLGGTQPALTWKNYPTIEYKPKRKTKNTFVPVYVARVDAERTTIFLRTQDNQRVLPIEIGHTEILSISSERSEEPLPRPLTQDLFGNLLDHVTGRVVETRITDLKKGTFHAELTLTCNGKPVVFDARPSDGIALAIKYQAPIYVVQKVFDRAGIDPLPGGAYRLLKSKSKARYPRRSWSRYKNPKTAGWSPEKLKAAEDVSQKLGSAAVVIVHKGTVISAWGAVEKHYLTHSIRKSFLSALYGIHVQEGRINLNKTLKGLNIDDVPPLNASEKQARVIDLLKARSGVYHNAAAVGPAQRKPRPGRGRYKRDEHWFYNNWDFNVLGTIFEQQTGANIFTDFYHRIAKPIGMEHYLPGLGTYQLEPEHSIHPAYHIRMSALDMARFGLLYLNKGRWMGQQIIPESWVEKSTRAYSQTESPQAGYGYMWWVQTGGPLSDLGMVSARGAGGHCIDVLPGADLVFVHRMDTDKKAFIKHSEHERLLVEILKAHPDYDQQSTGS